MSTSAIIILVVVLLALILVISIGTMYNSLINYWNRFKNSYSQIDVQLKRRYDLIPNLVETAKGYMVHEKGTLESVISARNAAASANAGAAENPGQPALMKNLVNAEGILTGSLGRLFALSEAYPDLKANSTMRSLMEELTSTENKVSFSRQSYNDSVMAYNIRRGVFPSNVVASLFHFSVAESFMIQKAVEREPPKVTFASGLTHPSSV